MLNKNFVNTNCKVLTVMVDITDHNTSNKNYMKWIQKIC